MRRLPPSSTRTDTLCPYTTLFRSILEDIPDIDFGVVRRAIFRAPSNDRRWREVGNAGVSGPHVVRILRANGFGRTLQHVVRFRSEEHTSELQSLMRTSYAVLCLNTTKTQYSLPISTLPSNQI